MTLREFADDLRYAKVRLPLHLADAERAGTVDACTALRQLTRSSEGVALVTAYFRKHNPSVDPQAVLREIEEGWQTKPLYSTNKRVSALLVNESPFARVLLDNPDSLFWKEAQRIIMEARMKRLSRAVEAVLSR